MNNTITNFINDITNMRDAIYSGKSIPFNPVKLRQDFDSVYATLKAENLTEDELSDTTNCSPFQKIAEIFWSFGVNINPSFFTLSQQTYELWLEKVLDFQRTQRKRIHKGTIYHQLGWIQDNFNKNPDNSYHFYLLAFIEDVHSSNENDAINRPACLNILTQFGVSTHKLKQFAKEVNTMKKFVNPEKILQDARNNILFPTYEELTVVDNNLIKELKTDWTSLATATIDTKGKMFENFTANFFSTIKGFNLRGKRLNAVSGNNTKEHDYDMIFSNKSALFSEFGNYFLIECKYTEEPVNYPEISKFFHKLHSKRCGCGILFTKNGIIGGNINSTIRGIYDSDGIIILTFDHTDISDVIEEKENLATLLKCKYEQVRFRLKNRP